MGVMFNEKPLVIALPYQGFDNAFIVDFRITLAKAAEIALKAWRDNKTLKQVAVELGYLTAEQYDKWVNPEEMIMPSHSEA